MIVINYPRMAKVISNQLPNRWDGFLVRDLWHYHLQVHVQRVRSENGTSNNHDATFNDCVHFVDRSQIAGVRIFIGYTQRGVASNYICSFVAEYDYFFFSNRCFNGLLTFSGGQARGFSSFISCGNLLGRYAFRFF